jgi:two-component system OmpR family sensor kinase
MHDDSTDWWGSISLRSKITGVTVLLLTVGLLVAGFGTMTSLRTYLLDEADSKISEEARSVTLNSSTCEQNGGPNSYFYAILNADGSLSCSNEGADDAPRLAGMSLSSVIALDGRPITVWDGVHQSQWRLVAVTGLRPNSPIVSTIVVGVNLNEINETITQFVGIFLAFGLSIVILGAALTRLLVTSTFTPLREVEATAAAIADGDFSQRLPGATPNTEVGRLNRSLNTMLGRIDRAFADRARTIAQMRRFVGDASHELRTPLVSVRGYAELYRMGALQTPEEVAQAMERIEKEAIRMGLLVEDLLELARIDEAKPLRLAPVDLVPIANDAALDAMASQPARTVTVRLLEPVLPEPEAQPEVKGRAASTVTGPISFAGAQFARLRRRQPKAPVPETPQPSTPVVAPADFGAIVLAEENKIRQVVTNLMGNALRFTAEDSPIELAIRVDRPAANVTLDIVDHGEGIPPQIRDRIFERFWRADTSRARETGGSGLGLAIVAGIVQSHKGKVDVLETPGGGATFRVTLPLLPPDYVPSEPTRPVPIVS